MAYTKEQAWELLTQYNKGEFHLKHANTVADYNSQSFIFT